MSNGTTVLNLSTFLVSVGGLPLSCFPKAGPIFTCAPLSDGASYTEGLNGCGAIVYAAGTGYEVTVNILAKSADHAAMDIRRAFALSKAQPLLFAASYGTSKWISAAVAIINNPTITVSEAGEFVPYVMRGSFEIASVGSWAQPESLGAADFE